MRIHLRAAVAAALALLSAAPAMAVSVTYRLQAFATGSLGGVEFTDALVRLSTSGNTNDVHDQSNHGVGPTELSIFGFSTVTLTDPSWVYTYSNEDQTANYVGFAAQTGSEDGALLQLTLVEPRIDLITAQHGTAELVGSGLSVTHTTGGDFSVYFAHDGSFDTILAVPEPTSWALMLAGFGATGAAMRRRRRVRVTFG